MLFTTFKSFQNYSNGKDFDLHEFTLIKQMYIAVHKYYLLHVILQGSKDGCVVTLMPPTSADMSSHFKFICGLIFSRSQS